MLCYTIESNNEAVEHCLLVLFLYFALLANRRVFSQYGSPATFQAGSHQLFTAETHVHSKGRQCANCGVESGNGIDFSPSYSVVSCQYHSFRAPYSFVFNQSVGHLNL
jgi:hypothetical protein